MSLGSLLKNPIWAAKWAFRLRLRQTRKKSSTGLYRPASGLFARLPRLTRKSHFSPSKRVFQETATLSALRKGQKGIIRMIASDNPDLQKRLWALGFLEGTLIEILHEAPISRSPIAVKISNGTIFAIGKEAADMIYLEEELGHHA